MLTTGSLVQNTQEVAENYTVTSRIFLSDKSDEQINKLRKYILKKLQRSLYKKDIKKSLTPEEFKNYYVLITQLKNSGYIRCGVSVKTENGKISELQEVFETTELGKEYASQLH